MNGKIFSHLSEVHQHPAAGRRPDAAPEVTVNWSNEGRGLRLSVELRHPLLPAPLITTIETTIEASGGSGHLVLRWPDALSNTTG